MTDEFDVDDDPEAVREALEFDLRTKGARAAYEALLQVAKDPKAPAPARATSGVALLRAAGFFNRDDDSGKGKPIHEMSMVEIERNIQKLQAKQKPTGRGRSRKATSVFD
jgi:hypothetical protein